MPGFLAPGSSNGVPSGAPLAWAFAFANIGGVASKNAPLMRAGMRWRKLKIYHAHPRPTVGALNHLPVSIKFYIYFPQSIESFPMALSIKNERAEELVRTLAQREGISMTGAIVLAVDNELKRQAAATEAEKKRRRAAIRAIQERIAKQTIDWSLTDDEILGYDENGLPT
jgi:antitoxin VapB